ncbi:MAG TPA: hypothetical protein VNO43_02795, partial [Candidatus Eisenbacteria bacterium]|nr:hypothetical protein [Candidatus Eisenbacteria bacterium]
GGAAGISLLFDTSGANPLLKIGGRSVSTDAFQSRTATSPVPTGQYVSLGGVIDFALDTITPYFQGVAENGGTVTFGNNAFTLGTPTGPDRIGAVAAVTITTTRQMDGRIAELSIWSGDIGAQAFQRLAAGWSAQLVAAQLGLTLLAYMRLLGTTSPEPDSVNGLSGTITGSIPQAAHPNIITSLGGVLGVTELGTITAVEGVRRRYW